MALDCTGLCTEYKNGEYHTPIKDINYATMEPFVELNIGNYKITTGNGSSGSISTASILNFEYGAVATGGNGGMSVKITIIDEAGSDLHRFLEHLFGCIQKADQHYKLKAKWGWYGRKSCYDDSASDISSTTITCLMQKLDVIFNEGKVKYEITANDLGPVSEASKVDSAYGSKDHPMRLKKAIEKMSEEVAPKWKTVFKNFDGTPCLFKESGSISPEEGPWSSPTWSGKQTSKIQTIRDWIKDYKCQDDNNPKDGSGFVVIWDYSAEEPTLRISKPVPPDTKMTLGTFIVNGGECSTVTSFTTNFNYIVGLASFEQGGNFNAEGKEEKIKVKYSDGVSAEDCQPTAGLSSVTIVNSNALANYPEDEATVKVIESNLANSKVDVRGISVIEAEMRIIGNPRLPFVWPMFSKPPALFCGVIVVNPFALKKTDSCPMWTHRTSCNEVLSNPKWIVMGIHHQIAAGNYTTTIKLTLNAPAINLAPGDMGNGFTING